MNIIQPLSRVPLRKVPTWIIAAVLVLAVVVTFAFLAPSLRHLFIEKPPPATENVPVYPSAQNISIERQPDTHTLPLGEPFERKTQVLTFETTDSREEVIAFYESVLGKEDWFNPIIDYPTPNPDNVFEWYQGSLDGITNLAYQLTIDYVPSPDGPAHVTITLIKFDSGFGSPQYRTPTPILG